MKAWKQGAIMGFLLMPILFAFGYTLRSIAALFKAETMAGIVDAIFMLPHVPMAIIHKKLGIHCSFYTNIDGLLECYRSGNRLFNRQV